MQVCSCVVGTADGEVSFDINGIDLPTILVEFMLAHPHPALLIEPHAVMQVRGFMMEAAAIWAEVSHGIVGTGDAE